MQVIDDFLDLVAFLFLGGLVFSVAFGLILPMVYDTFNPTNEVIADKTAPITKGYDNVYSNYDGTMNIYEVILTTQVQDYELPSPKRYVIEPDGDVSSIEGLDVTVGSLYKEDPKQYGVATFNQLINVDPDKNGRYEIKYSYGPTSDPSDDFYYIVRVR